MVFFKKNGISKSGNKYCRRCEKSFPVEEHFKKFITHKSEELVYYICKDYLEEVKDTPKYKGEKTKRCNYCNITASLSHFTKVEQKNGKFKLMCEQNILNAVSKVERKQCTKCGGETFPVHEHFTKFTEKDGSTSYVCNKSSLYQRYLNREKYGYHDSPKAKKNKGLKARYNITLDDYEEMLFQQDNKCAICNALASTFKKGLFVDHCHITGKVRGLLCLNCNTTLGKFKDNTETLYSAINYLNKHK